MIPADKLNDPSSEEFQTLADHFGLRGAERKPADVYFQETVFQILRPIFQVLSR